MHDSALENGRRFFETYVDREKKWRVIEIGSQDVNGSLRSVCPPNVEYVGVDFVAGKGVDIILSDPYKLPFSDESSDIVVSSSCFEHSEHYWILYLEIMRILRPSGLFYLNAPSNGGFHQWPVDCWRFYPDSGNALAKWGKANGIDSIVLESFTSDQVIDAWNDYVCIFIKSGQYADRYPHRVLDTFREFSNGTLFRDGGTISNINRCPNPQDQRYLGWRIHKLFAKTLIRAKQRLLR